jgi:hypothetical protein
MPHDLINLIYYYCDISLLLYEQSEINVHQTEDGQRARIPRGLQPQPV